VNEGEYIETELTYLGLRDSICFWVEYLCNGLQHTVSLWGRSPDNS